MPHADAINSLVATYGALGLFAVVGVGALGIGVPIPVTALLLTIGALSGARGGPDFALVAVAALLGAVAGHLVDYWTGRLGNRLLQRWLDRSRSDRGVGALVRWALRLRGGRSLLVFLTRFLLTSIASPVSLLAGTSGMPFGRYLVLEVGGEAIYVLGNLTLGRVFGDALLAHGVPVAFWLAVAALTVAPLVLLRGITWALSRRSPEGPRPMESAAPSR